MSDQPTPEELQNRRKVFGIMDRHLDAAFTDLEKLHRDKAMTDEDIIATLNSGGYTNEAEAYQEWIAEDDPSRDYRDPTPHGAELVTDPMDSDSNRLMRADLERQRRAAGGITFEWTEVETVRYTRRATFDKKKLKEWLEVNATGEDELGNLSGYVLGWYLEESGWHGPVERSNREVDPSPDVVDLKVVDE